jgi:hypothetical protein
MTNGSPLLMPLVFLAAAMHSHAQNGAPPSSLPDPLIMADGTRVTTAAQWRNNRRPEAKCGAPAVKREVV